MTLALSPGQGPSLSMRRSTWTLLGIILRSLASTNIRRGIAGRRWSTAVAPRSQVWPISSFSTSSGAMLAMTDQRELAAGAGRMSIEWEAPNWSATFVMWREKAWMWLGDSAKQGWLASFVMLESKDAAATCAVAKAALTPLPGQNSTCKNQSWHDQ